MFGLSFIDIGVIVVYFVVLIFIGVWAMKRIKNQEDFFLGGRRFGKVIQIFGAFGQATSSETGPSVTTTTANNGASGIWSALMMLFSTPSYWLTGPWYRRLRVVTMGDYFAERFSSKFLGGVYAVMASISLMLLLTVGFIGMAKTVTIMTPKPESELTMEEKQELKSAIRLDELEAANYTRLSAAEKEELTMLRAIKPQKNFSYINRNALIIIMVIVVCVYSIAGGLEAAFISDMMQGVFIILLSILLLPFAFHQINLQYGSTGVMGAFRTLHEQLPESFFEIFGSPSSIDFTWYYIAGLSLMATINVAAGANQLVATASAKNEYSARVGLTYGTFLKRITTVLWGLTAIAIVLLFGKEVNDPDKLWGYASRELLAPLNAGLIGLMIASLMAALMSTADMMMLTCSGLITHSVYRPLRPGMSENHYVQTGRFFGALIVIGAAIIVINSDSLFNQLKIHWEWGVVFSAGFWMGILWRKANRKGVWYSILLTMLLFFLIPLIIPAAFPSLRTNEYLLKQTSTRVIERTYTARQHDVEERNRAIANYGMLAEFSTASLPDSLYLGDTFIQKYKLPSKSIFWTGGIEITDNEVEKGVGMLSLELIILDKLGFKMENNPYALNETIRILIRTLFPFLILIIVSLYTKIPAKEEKNLDRFYVKMKTKVQTDKEEDAKEMAISYANPHRFDHKKMLPNTSWEFMKWSREDTTGFLTAILVVIGILGLLYLVVNIGS